MKKVSVVLPTYNEVANVEKTTQKVLDQQKSLPGFEISVIIANDVRSSDGTKELGKKLAARKNIYYIEVEPGLGVGLIEGHKFALKNLKPDILAQLDADGQVEADVVVRMVKAIEEGYNLAIGSRFVKGGKNQLSFTRRLFTTGASMFFRIMVGPWDVAEVTNSARAFTPELFARINLQRLPWKERTFIVQPAFLHEAILAGAKYKEVPLVFKNRLEGYSKNKVFNYTYDVISYCLDARLHSFGIKLPLYRYSRKAKTLVKFSLVGVVGTVVDFFFYKMFINMLALPPATAKGFSAEIAIMNNFFLNNFWTFKYRKTKTNLWQKLAIFNLVSLGGLVIAVLVVKFLHNVYGDGFVWIGAKRIAFNNFYFFATIPPVMIWNFTVNHFITWRHQED